MAINVLNVKYPYSDTGKMMSDEVRGIDPTKVVLSEKACKIVEKQAKLVKLSDTDLLDLKAVDARIAKLMAERETIVNLLRKSSLDAVSEALGFTYKVASRINKDFSEIGLSAGSVSKAVKKVRTALFDDTNKQFQDVWCTGVVFGGDDDELMFEFEHQPTGRCFRVDIPVFSDNYEEDSNGMSRGRKYDSASGNVYGIGVTYPFTSSYEGSISYHYDIRVVREQLKMLAERDFEPPSCKRSGYVVAREWPCGKPVMDIYDYIRESQE